MFNDTHTPFFSVCIPATDRGDTIFDTLCSVAEQTFRDFEVVITDSMSHDATQQEIDNFFLSDFFTRNPFVYQYIKHDNRPVLCSDWNDPIIVARGKYIAMLEGDDKYHSNHLQNAYNTLSQDLNIGLYAVSNQNHTRQVIGLIESRAFVNEIYKIEDIPPPSESIFIRLDRDGTSFLYNTDDYLYAPEIDLYMRIAIAGFNAHYSTQIDVWRKSSSRRKGFNWNVFKDRITIFSKYRSYVTDEVHRHSLCICRHSIVGQLVFKGRLKDLNLQMVKILRPYLTLKVVARMLLKGKL